VLRLARDTGLEVNISLMDTDRPIPAQSDDEISGEAHEIQGRMPDEPRDDSGWTTTKAAAKSLGVTRRTVQEYVRKGELEAFVEGEGVAKKYYVSIDSLTALRERRRREAKKAPDIANVSSWAESSEKAGEGRREALGEVLRRAIERLETRTAEAADLRARLELTEKAESTLRESLERERERADALQRETDRLRTELEEARLSWWRRFFGFR
jgi:excisionase family DNA binding protein